MIKFYENGESFIAENETFLKTDEYQTVFLFLDAKLLTKTDKHDYALLYEENGKKLVAIQVEPYNLMPFGEASLLPTVVDYLIENGYDIKNVLANEEIGDAFVSAMKKHGAEYTENLAMDFMSTTEYTEPSCDDVVTATEADTAELVECLEHFVIDCGLLDKINPDDVREIASRHRVLKQDGKIISMARVSPSGDNDMRITAVYTRPEYRGKGYARKVVNTAKNEILSAGKTATLNVDKKNPISNKLYASLGFKKLFSQGEYRKTDLG